MGIAYQNLDEITRNLMAAEISMGNHYESPRLTPAGLIAWPQLLQTAAQQHSDDWLAQELLRLNYFRAEESYVRNGATHKRKINAQSAATQLAEGEFNRYYARALCVRAEQEGKSVVTVYRGKAVSQPRPESEALIGKGLQVGPLLNALRANDFVTIEATQGVPGGPNSGLTCKL